MMSLQNRDLDLELDFRWDADADGDHQSFLNRDIPFLMLHTGVHEDYHRPSDDAEKINTEGLQQLARLTFHIALEAAEQPTRNVFRSAARRESDAEKRRFEAPLAPFPPRLGVWWDAGQPMERGLRLTNVAAGSPAEEAGLRSGDRLVKLADRDVDDEQQFRMNLLAAKTPVRVLVERPGQSAPLALDVRLSGSPLRLGVSWREDDAEPGVVMLTRVAPGSPAQRAGLQPCDRIYEIAGRGFRDGDELAKLASSLPSPLELLVERNGRMRTATLDVPEPAAPP
jgi:predicted metalloprotease with PDZ domain